VVAVAKVGEWRWNIVLHEMALPHVLISEMVSSRITKRVQSLRTTKEVLDKEPWCTFVIFIVILTA